MTAAIATFEDSALIEMALAGKPEGFSVLMSRHKATVRKRIMRMVKDTSDVDDLVAVPLPSQLLHVDCERGAE
jgi:hypothetical protein